MISICIQDEKEVDENLDSPIPLSIRDDQRGDVERFKGRKGRRKEGKERKKRASGRT